MQPNINIEQIITSVAAEVARDTVQEQLSSVHSTLENIQATLGVVTSDPTYDGLGEQVAAITIRLDKLEKRKPRKITYKINGTEYTPAPGTIIHPQFKLLLTALARGLSPWLVGPAGSGKTHAAEQAAIALGLPFYTTSVCGQTSKSDLVGYVGLNGKYVDPCGLRRAVEQGGVFLLDEVDAGNPNVLIVLNALLSNKWLALMDGTVVRAHKDFHLICAANTVGNGATGRYVGRNPIDAATLDRFFLIDWDYDEALERALANDHPLCEWLQLIRREARRLARPFEVSTRRILQTVKMSDLPKAELIDNVVFRGASDDDKTKLLGLTAGSFPGEQPKTAATAGGDEEAGL